MDQTPSRPRILAPPGDLASAADGGGCADLDIRITRDGQWHYHGLPIGRKELVCLFSSVLTRDEAGDYWLVTPSEVGRIQVDDAPFLAVEAFRVGEGENQVISLRTNVDEIIVVDGDHPLRIEVDPNSGEPSPYVVVRECMEARLTRSVYYELVGLGCERNLERGAVFGIWSSRIFFPL